MFIIDWYYYYKVKYFLFLIMIWKNFHHWLWMVGYSIPFLDLFLSLQIIVFAYLAFILLFRCFLLHPPCYTRFVFLACARCFGKFLWVAAFASDFGEHLCKTIMKRKFAALQQHCRFFFRKKNWKIIFGNNFRGNFRSFGKHLFGVVLNNNFGKWF